MSALALPIGAVGLTLGTVGTVLGGVAVEKAVANEKSIKDIQESVDALNDSDGNKLVTLDETLDVALFKKAPVIVDYQLPPAKGSSMQVLSMSADGISTTFRSVGGTGTVVGPSSSTASHIALFADAGGVEIVEAPVSVDIATGNMANVGTINGVSVATLSTTVATNTTSIGTNGTAITALQTSVGTNTTDIGTNDTAITALQTSVGTNTTDIGTNDTAITALQTSVGTNTTGISTNGTAITALQTSVGTNTTGISTNGTAITALQTSVGTNTNNIATNAEDIAALGTTVGTNTTSIGTNGTAITALQTSVGTNTASIASLNYFTAVGSAVMSAANSGSSGTPPFTLNFMKLGSMVTVEVRFGTMNTDVLYGPIAGNSLSGQGSLDSIPAGTTVSSWQPSAGRVGMAQQFGAVDPTSNTNTVFFSGTANFVFFGGNTFTLTMQRINKVDWNTGVAFANPQWLNPAFSFTYLAIA